jgi:hypothetical protein
MGGGKGWPIAENFLKLVPDAEYCFRVRATTRSLGDSSCVSPWSAWACARTDAGDTKVCEAYAKQAVDTVKMARDFYKCLPSLISGPRWTDKFADHKDWCMGATPQARKSESDARAKGAQECRVVQDPGNPTLTVTVARSGDSFTVTGAGFQANAPVIITLSGPAAQTPRIASVSGQRIIADAQGKFTVTLIGAMVCKTSGQVEFNAEDQDGVRKTKTPAVVTCKP